LAALRREAAGAFTLDHAHTLEEVQATATRSALADLLLPPGAGLTLPVLLVDAETERRLGYGQQVSVPAALLEGPPPRDGLAQALDVAGRLAGIVAWQGSASEGAAHIWKAEKWFAAATPQPEG
jgi:tRNA U55 pseudouridine synthase TruB